MSPPFLRAPESPSQKDSPSPVTLGDRGVGASPSSDERSPPSLLKGRRPHLLRGRRSPLSGVSERHRGTYTLVGPKVLKGPHGRPRNLGSDYSAHQSATPCLARPLTGPSAGVLPSPHGGRRVVGPSALGAPTVGLLRSKEPHRGGVRGQKGTRHEGRPPVDPAPAPEGTLRSRTERSPIEGRLRFRAGGTNPDLPPLTHLACPAVSPTP